jgi:hypothetical protein
VLDPFEGAVGVAVAEAVEVLVDVAVVEAVEVDVAVVEAVEVLVDVAVAVLSAGGIENGSRPVNEITGEAEIVGEGVWVVGAGPVAPPGDSG